MIQRDTRFFGTKAFYAEQAGAEAVIIFNQGNTPEREGLIVADATSFDNPDGTVGTVTHNIPVVGASFADGVALAQEGSTAFVEVLPPETRTDFNVFAEKVGENPDNVVMAGAHLDSVIEGPGIQDNGSGSAALLETALLMSKVETENTIRFAWWAAEEIGLLGSPNYIFMSHIHSLWRARALISHRTAPEPPTSDRVATLQPCQPTGATCWTQSVDPVVCSTCWPTPRSSL